MIREEVKNINGYIWPKGTLEKLVKQIENNKIYVYGDSSDGNKYHKSFNWKLKLPDQRIGMLIHPMIEDNKLYAEVLSHRSDVLAMVDSDHFRLNSMISGTPDEQGIIDGNIKLFGVSLHYKSSEEIAEIEKEKAEKEAEKLRKREKIPVEGM